MNLSNNSYMKPILTVLKSIKNSLFHNSFFEKKYKQKRISILNVFFHNKVVLNGPFAGMKYPKIYSNSSAIYPKLIGSYESELGSTIHGIFKKSYRFIYDIGCAEGYYAIGLALKFEKSIIHAFDIDEKALENCRRMGELNNVNNVIYNTEFKFKELQNYDFNNSLIICDCEGLEKEIFQFKNINHFKMASMIIEVHDFIHNGLSHIINSNFRKTHQINIIKSTSDFYKIVNYNFHKPLKVDILMKKYLYSEYRPTIMTWLVLEPKNN